jgi:hypothetical protein
MVHDKFAMAEKREREREGGREGEKDLGSVISWTSSRLQLED